MRKTIFIINKWALDKVHNECTKEKKKEKNCKEIENTLKTQKKNIIMIK